MTKKLRRHVDFVFDDNGEVNRPVRAGLLGGAILTMDDGHVGQDRIFIHTDHFYTKRALDELIAELLFLKEEWENHPVYLEQEQVEDMEEIAEEFPDEWMEEGDLPMEPDIHEQEMIGQPAQENPFEDVANQREEELHRVDFDEMVRHARRFIP